MQPYRVHAEWIRTSAIVGVVGWVESELGMTSDDRCSTTRQSQHARLLLVYTAKRKGPHMRRNRGGNEGAAPRTTEALGRKCLFAPAIICPAGWYSNFCKSLFLYKFLI